MNEASRAPVKLQPPEFLWIAPRAPLPANDGARRATVDLINALAALGAKIHLLAIHNRDDAMDADAIMRDLKVESVRLILQPPKSRIGQVLRLLASPGVPITVSSFATGPVRAAILAALAEAPERIVVHDGAHAAGWMLGERERGERHFVFRPHNVERDLWMQSAERARNPLVAALLRWQGTLMERFELRVAAAARSIFPVSDQDSAYFRAAVPDRIVETLPIAVSLDARALAEAPAPTGPSLLFVGRLDWPPNRDGLTWFLDTVWRPARERRPDLRLTIIGSGNGRWLEAYRDGAGLTVLGRVDHLEPHYGTCIATIAPVFVGSGTRVKVIESCVARRACISTAIGVEGVGLSPGVSYVRAESANDWIEALVGLALEPMRIIGESAHAAVASRFDPLLVAARFLRTVAAVEDVVHE